ncbi:MAG: tetratricopeptide repeat protein [Nitrospirota bacterium]|jgi:tetratricopeptide (TPR) repeat protein
MKKRLLLTAIITLALAGTCLSQGAPATDPRVSELGQAIEAAESDGDRALLHKELGEVLVEAGDLEGAAREFIRALSLYDGFSPRERLSMGVHISWAERYGDALRVIRDVVAEKPEYVEARIYLSRTLALDGQYEEALEEADAALRLRPGDLDAMVARGDALNWSGRYDSAREAYGAVLAEREDFEARLGLAYVFLAQGETHAARRQMELLSAVLPYQERELMKLRGAIGRASEPTPGELASDERFERTLREYRESIGGAATDGERAALHKELGDLYVLRDDHESAAREYMSALELSPGFSEEERLGMAVSISWAARYREAAAVLEGILSENPDNLKARVHLARTLSWDGRYGEAIGEADKVLAARPEDPEALLVKANALNWRSDHVSARPLYKSLLAEDEEDFDARLGLAQTQLYAGNIRRARSNFALLEPAYPYQRRAYERLQRSLRRATRPRLEASYYFYDDSDENQYNRYEATLSVPAGDIRADVRYRHTAAKDPARSNDSDEASAGIYARLAERLGAGGGVGYAQFDNGGSTSIVTWNARVDLDVPRGGIGVIASRKPLNETAQLIENRVSTESIGVYGDQSFSRGWSASASYTYRDYSDSNRSHDARLNIMKTLRADGPRLGIGYRFRYLDFRRQSGSGYFDPDNYTSHQLIVSLRHEGDKGYVYLEPYVGAQFFDRFAVSSEDFIAGGYGALGLHLGKNVTLELNAEGGDLAVDSAAGFSYYILGSRLIVMF